MRLFVAIELNADVRKAAARTVEELKARAARLAPQARVTWVAPERMHLTLQFIGEVDPDRADVIERALGPAFKTAPFEVQFAGTGVFPHAGRPRVIWAGVVAGEDSLIALARLVSARIAGAGTLPDDRAFRPHLTLARVRDAAGLRSEPSSRV